MLKLLLLAVVIGVVAWMLGARRRPPGQRKPPAPGSTGADKVAPAPMLACAHCGVHVPQSDAVFDAGGQGFCTEAHRLAGVR